MRTLAAAFLTLSLIWSCGCSTPTAVVKAYDEMVELQTEQAMAFLELLDGLPRLDETRALAKDVAAKHKRFMELGYGVGGYLKIPGVEGDIDRFLAEVEKLLEKLLTDE